jgi:hypothetical protein
MPGTITILNKHHGHTDGIDIMRGTPLGNPYPITDDCPRELSLERYREWLRQQYTSRTGDAYKQLMWLVDRYEEGWHLRLLCVCKPKACHGDIIKQAVEGIYQQRTKRRNRQRVDAAIQAYAAKKL